MDHRCFGRNGRGWYDFWLFNKYLHVNRRERERLASVLRGTSCVVSDCRFQLIIDDAKGSINDRCVPAVGLQHFYLDWKCCELLFCAWEVFSNATHE